MKNTSVNIPHPKYRADIDGLRAVAIIAVVIFHAFRDILPGGFIGVDIFFVISGFLISTILFSGLEKDRFSIVEFYVRRVRRIFPALITVMIACIVLAWLFLFSDELERFGRHLTAGITFISNFIFWRESGYFDSSSETKPLLHFWSLAIEEQFYLFWPILLAFLWKSKFGILKPVILIAVISFALNILFLKNHPVASFFLPFTRVWELIAGGILAYILLYKQSLLSRYHNLQSISGFILIIVGFIYIHEEGNFPGWWALLPTMGAFFIISAGSTAWLNQKILSNKIMIWVGNISYPMYLWHWPLLSFAFIVYDGQVDNTQLAGILILTTVLSWLTYRYIENPIRFGRYKTKAIPIMLMVMLSMLIVALFLFFGKVSPRNNSPELQTFLEARNDRAVMNDDFIKVSFNREKFFFLPSDNKGKTLIIGDSHALQYAPRAHHLFTTNSKKLNTIYFAVHEGCLPVPGLKQDNADLNERVCNEYRNSILELMKDPEIKTIILAGCWNCYLIQDENPNNRHMETNKYAQKPFKTKILSSLKSFLVNSKKTKNVYLVLDNPVGATFDPSDHLKGNRLSGFSVEKMHQYGEFIDVQMALRNELLAIANTASVNVIDPSAHLCSGNKCKSLDVNGSPIYSDNNHLRASYVGKSITYMDEAFVTN